MRALLKKREQARPENRQESTGCFHSGAGWDSHSALSGEIFRSFFFSGVLEDALLNIYDCGWTEHAIQW
jgi:hypothetical protein